MQELKGELANLKDTNKKSLNVKDKQIEQLVDGFQKQMQLIDVLRRQKVNKEKDIEIFFLIGITCKFQFHKILINETLSSY